MASFGVSKLIQQLLVLFAALAIVTFATPLEKRATQVSLIGYTFSNNVLAGSINVRVFMLAHPPRLSEFPPDPKHCLCQGCDCRLRRRQYVE